MLNRHPRIAIPLESLFIVDYLRAADRVPITRLKGLLIKEPELAEWGLQVSRNDLAACRTVPECIARLHELYCIPRGADVWGQKTPRFVRYLDLLRAGFPAAKVVHIVRDPRAVVSSLVQSDVHRSDAYHAAIRWLRDVEKGLAFENVHPEAVLRLRYEDLVLQPEAHLNHILEFLGLPLPEAAASETPAGAGEYSEFYAHIHANLDRPPTTEFVDKWESHLSPAEIELVETVCSSRMEALGYPKKTVSSRVDARFVRKLKFRRYGLLLFQAYRYLRFRPRYLVFVIWRKWRLGLLSEFLRSVNF
jgi:hypothetical protein